MNIELWLLAMFLLGILAMGIIFVFLKGCERM